MKSKKIVLIFISVCLIALFIFGRTDQSPSWLRDQTVSTYQPGQNTQNNETLIASPTTVILNPTEPETQLVPEINIETNFNIDQELIDLENALRQ